MKPAGPALEKLRRQSAFISWLARQRPVVCQSLEVLARTPRRSEARVVDLVAGVGEATVGAGRACLWRVAGAAGVQRNLQE